MNLSFVHVHAYVDMIQVQMSPNVLLAVSAGWAAKMGVCCPCINVNSRKCQLLHPPHFGYHPSIAVGVFETATTPPDHSKFLHNHVECSVVCEIGTASHKTFGYIWLPVQAEWECQCKRGVFSTLSLKSEKN
jgi:hypothetical protein